MVVVVTSILVAEVLSPTGGEAAHPERSTSPTPAIKTQVRTITPTATITRAVPVRALMSNSLPLPRYLTTHEWVAQ